MAIPEPFLDEAPAKWPVFAVSPMATRRLPLPFRPRVRQNAGTEGEIWPWPLGAKPSS
jgi:hypothetical protein